MKTAYAKILAYPKDDLKYSYNPKDSDRQEFLSSLDHLLPNKDTYYTLAGIIKRSTEQTLDKQGVHCNLYTIITNLAQKFDEILCFGFGNNRNLVVGHLEYGKNILVEELKKLKNVIEHCIQVMRYN